MTNPVVRAWRRFTTCSERRWSYHRDGSRQDFPLRPFCLRRCWHRGDCEGFTSDATQRDRDVLDVGIALAARHRAYSPK